MKLRIAFLSVLFLFLAGAALATPTTGDARDPSGATLVTDWDLGAVATPAYGYALGPQAPIQQPTELAVYWPCGCTPIPGCPFPIPWPLPGGPTIFNPFPPNGPCGPCPF